MQEDRKAFFEDLVTFYKTSVMGTAESVDTLANIEEKYPENYLKLKEATFDPNNIEEILSSMNEEEKEVFLLIFTKAGILSRKLNQLFELTIEDKRKLAKDIKDFVRFVEKKLRELEESKIEKGETNA